MALQIQMHFTKDELKPNSNFNAFIQTLGQAVQDKYPHAKVAVICTQIQTNPHNSLDCVDIMTELYEIKAEVLKNFNKGTSALLESCPF